MHPLVALGYVCCVRTQRRPIREYIGGVAALRRLYILWTYATQGRVLRYVLADHNASISVHVKLPYPPGFYIHP